MARVFIDGQAGTTGLEIFDRLKCRDDIELVTISDADRKDRARRQDCLQASDVSILCLPDDAARESVELTDGKARLLDASTAHRTADDWTYGLPELDATTRDALARARLVSNPGCYPQGFILLVRPLIQAGWLAAETLLRCNAVSGYSGGGRKMVESFRAYDDKQADALNTQAYGLTLEHKHVPEMRVFSGTSKNPIFAPSVANYYKGMLVQVPLFVEELGGAGADRVFELLSDTYASQHFVRVIADSEGHTSGYLNPTACNDTNFIDLMVFGNDEQLILTARYDNLGKGASGAAVQNLNIMLGIPEGTGL